MRLEIKINWEKQISKQKQQQKQKQAKTNQKKKIVTTEKEIPSQPQSIFSPKDLSQVVYLFLSQKSAY